MTADVNCGDFDSVIAVIVLKNKSLLGGESYESPGIDRFLDWLFRLGEIGLGRSLNTFPTLSDKAFRFIVPRSVYQS